MTGRNLHESGSIVTASYGSRSHPAQLDVFVSHSSLDKSKAREVVVMLKAMHIDHYFDEHDEDLAAAVGQSDHLAVVHCIEKGLTACTHILGIITENTKESWWVPYELGGAAGRGRQCAHLIDANVIELPSYIKAAEVLTDLRRLTDWFPREQRSAFESLKRAVASVNASISFVPHERSLATLVFRQ